MNEYWENVIDHPLYQVSNLGNFKSLKTGKCMKTQKERYARITLDGIKYLAHRVVAKQFCPNRNNLPNVNHINGNKHDNRAENLEWVTQKQNINHAWESGLAKKRNGEKMHTSWLDDMHILTLATIVNHKPIEEIANWLPGRKERTSTKNKIAQIKRIKKGERWPHLNFLFTSVYSK